MTLFTHVVVNSNTKAMLTPPSSEIGFLQTVEHTVPYFQLALIPNQSTSLKYYRLYFNLVSSETIGAPRRHWQQNCM